MREKKNTTIEQIHPREEALKYVSTYPRPPGWLAACRTGCSHLSEPRAGLRRVYHPLARRHASPRCGGISAATTEKADTALEGQHTQAADYLTRLASSGELAGVGTAL